MNDKTGLMDSQMHPGLFYYHILKLCRYYTTTGIAKTKILINLMITHEIAVSPENNLRNLKPLKNYCQFPNAYGKGMQYTTGVYLSR